MAGRIHEIAQVAEANQAAWLASQIDEVEERALTAVEHLASKLDALTDELRATRVQMSQSAQRLVWSTLSASMTLLIAVLAAIVSGWVR